MEESKGEKEREGKFLLGCPKFEDLGGGRLRCVETGHELPEREKETYSRSKACRVALIDVAVSKRKPPLNLFKPHPEFRSKLVCELTGDTVNKSEEHIWKHISGKRFQNKLEQKEAEKVASPRKAEKDAKMSNKKPRKIVAVKDRKKDSSEIAHQPREPVAESSDSDEPDFWGPPVGDRWDNDNGKDRWGSSTSSGHETDEDSGLDKADQKGDSDPAEISARTKRMSIAVGPSSFASRKKKAKNNS